MTIAHVANQFIGRLTPASIVFSFAVIIFGQAVFANDASSSVQIHKQSGQGPQSLQQSSPDSLPELSPELLPEVLRESPSEQQPAELVLVAGATGGTGREVIRELLANGYRVRAFVRDEQEARASLGDEVEIAVGDVRERATIDVALNGVDALISAIGAGRGDPGNTPEFVDYGGVKNMVEASAGLRQFVLVSAAGVTQEDHVLNKMFNNVLKWKFKGEEALRASGVPYTIIRPGGLDDGPGGQKSIVFVQGDDESSVIPRADLARICVAALGSAAAVNKTFEVAISKLPADDRGDNNFGAAFADLATDIRQPDQNGDVLAPASD